MAAVKDHRELDVWKLADQVRRLVRPLIERPGFRTDFALRDQIRDAAESPCPNIAEGFSRYLPRDFARFLRIAKASLSELLEHLDRAVAQRLITAEEAAAVASYARRSRGAASKLIVYLESAKPPGIKR
jgi:four helix bundle protein